MSRIRSVTPQAKAAPEQEPTPPGQRKRDEHRLVSLGYLLTWLIISLPAMAGALFMLRTGVMVVIEEGFLLTFLAAHSLALASPLFAWALGRAWLAHVSRKSAWSGWVLTGCAPRWALSFAGWTGVGLFGLNSLFSFNPYARVYLFAPLAAIALLIIDIWWLVLFLRDAGRGAVLERVPMEADGHMFVLSGRGEAKRVQIRISDIVRWHVRIQPEGEPAAVWQALVPVDALEVFAKEKGAKAK